MESRFWIDDNPIEKPYGENTYGIVDEMAGGVVAYVGGSTLALCLMSGFFQSGTPAEDRYGREPCKTCKGTRRISTIGGRAYTANEPCPDCKPDKVKPLAQWIDEWDLAHPDERNTREYFQQALDAYESTENVKIRIERV